jgi:hypothetical protein
MKVWTVVCSNYYGAASLRLEVANAKVFASIGAAKEYIRLDKDCYDDYIIFEDEVKF